MDTYFTRHSSRLDVDKNTLSLLWDSKKIAIHFPWTRSGVTEQDSESLDPAQYDTPARKAINALLNLAKNGGFVCAEYRGYEDVLIGEVAPDSQVEIIKGSWGNLYGLSGREAVLKALQLQNVKVIKPCDNAVILVGRPRQGTLMKWPRAGQHIANLVRGVSVEVDLADLSPDQQEVLCAEFLRLPQASTFGLPTLSHLLLPVGRTMKDIDIFGFATDNKRIYAQVTYSSLASASEKMDRLRKYASSGSHLVLFCKEDVVSVVDGVIVMPIRLVSDSFRSSPSGNLWYSFAVPKAS